MGMAVVAAEHKLSTAIRGASRIASGGPNTPDAPTLHRGSSDMLPCQSKEGGR